MKNLATKYCRRRIVEDCLCHRHRPSATWYEDGAARGSRDGRVQQRAVRAWIRRWRVFAACGKRRVSWSLRAVEPGRPPANSAMFNIRGRHPSITTCNRAGHADRPPSPHSEHQPADRMSTAAPNLPVDRPHRHSIIAASPRSPLLSGATVLSRGPLPLADDVLARLSLPCASLRRQRGGPTVADERHVDEHQGMGSASHQ